MSKLEGKVAVVTGASKGIGASIAEHLGAEGASVVVNYATSKQGADKVVEKITSKGGKAIAVQADTSKQDDIKRLFAETKQAFGKLDILVNNAGIFKFAPLEAITPEHFHQQFDINVLGVLLATQEAVKLMSEGSSIINISSLVANSGFPSNAVYSATKAALDQVTRTLATELGPKKIRVNSVNPGLIITEGVQAMEGTDEFQKQVLAMTPLGRLGQPEDIASVVTFYASNDSRWITGQEIVVAGGARG